MADSVNIKHVFGNPLQIAIPLTQRIRTLVDGQEIERTEDFFPSGDVKVVLWSNIRTYEYIATMDGNVAIITDDKGEVSSGLYGVTITCLDQEGKPRRFARADAIRKWNVTNHKEKCEHNGFCFYKDNPDTTVDKVIKKIFEVCGI